MFSSATEHRYTVQYWLRCLNLQAHHCLSPEPTLISDVLRPKTLQHPGLLRSVQEPAYQKDPSLSAYRTGPTQPKGYEEDRPLESISPRVHSDSSRLSSKALTVFPRSWQVHIDAANAGNIRLITVAISTSTYGGVVVFSVPSA